MKKSDSGITLVALVITIIILLILGTTATVTGIEAVEESRLMTFKTEMKIMKLELNSDDELEKYKKTDSDTLTDQQKLFLNKVQNELNNDNIQITLDIVNFKFFTKAQIKDLSSQEISTDLYINANTKTIISSIGVDYQGKTYYMLEQLPDNLYNVEEKIQNSGNVEFELTSRDNQIIISNIKYNAPYVEKGTIQYKLSTDEFWTTVAQDIVAKNYTFEVPTFGEYNIKIIDAKNNEGINNITINYSIVKPELKIGDEVIYNPSGTYNWQAEYCSSTKTIKTDDVTLDSSTEDFKITNWKIFSISEDKNTIELISSEPTTEAVYLGGAQGYNNGVTLLNEACNSLYGNASKGITARSINIEDVESRMTDEALNGEDGVYKYSSEYATYNSQRAEITKGQYYPIIYGKEKLSVIDGNKKTTGLGSSDKTTLIKRTDEGAKDGYLTATKSLQPYHTTYQKLNPFMQTAFKGEGTGTNNTNYNLIIPKGEDTTYWIASRCITLYTNTYYCMRLIYVGGITRCTYLLRSNSDGNPDGAKYELRPILSLNSSILNYDDVHGWNIE